MNQLWCCCCLTGGPSRRDDDDERSVLHAHTHTEALQSQIALSPAKPLVCWRIYPHYSTSELIYGRHLIITTTWVGGWIWCGNAIRSVDHWISVNYLHGQIIASPPHLPNKSRGGTHCNKSILGSVDRMGARTLCRINKSNADHPRVELNGTELTLRSMPSNKSSRGDQTTPPRLRLAKSKPKLDYIQSGPILIPPPTSHWLMHHIHILSAARAADPPAPCAYFSIPLPSSFMAKRTNEHTRRPGLGYDRPEINERFC